MAMKKKAAAKAGAKAIKGKASAGRAVIAAKKAPRGDQKAIAKPLVLVGDSRIDGAALERYVSAIRPEFESALRELVETPTVSSDPLRKPDIARGADLAADLFRRNGGTARIVKTSGNPVVVGELGDDSAGTRTVTVYNHLDVQPAYELEEGWSHPPFTLTLDGDRYLGRGSTDDKGPALSAFFAACHARAEGVPLRVRFIWELEEEIGSPNFEEFLKLDRANLATDSILVSDTVWVSRQRPALSYGLRGLLGMAFRLRTGAKDVHSGLTGGAARNPFTELAEVIARCVDGKSGKIKIPGVYDDVRKLTKEELEGFLASGFTVPKFMQDHGFKSIRSKDRAQVLKSIWSQPTFEVHGWGGGYTGPAIKTIVPPFAEAKVSMRLVPNQDPEKIFKKVKAFVAAINPDVEVVKHGVLAPFLGPKDGPYIEAAQNAIRATFGKPAVFVREGGSIGAVLSMQHFLKAPILLLGLSLPEHGYHAPNEFFDWGQASGGMRVFARYFDQIARMK